MNRQIEQRPPDESRQDDLLLPATKSSPSHLSIWSLMLVTTVCCLMAAAGNQMLKALRADNLPRSKFVMFTLTAPVIALVGISLTRFIWRMIVNRRR